MDYFNINSGEYDEKDFETLGLSVFYSQINDTLFTVGWTREYIQIYNLNSKTFHESYISTTQRYASCLASSESSLYISGGFAIFKATKEVVSDLLILDWSLEEQTWINSTDMTYSRGEHGCIVVNDTLWVMGYVQQIENMDITSNHDALWVTQGSLPVNLTIFGIVAVHDMIFIVGGYNVDCDTDCAQDTMYIIDTNNGRIDIQTMGFSVYGMPVVEVDNVIYGFGGLNELGVAMSSWAQYNMLSDKWLSLESTILICSWF